MKSKDNENQEGDMQLRQQPGRVSTTAEEALVNDEDTLDIGEAGQFAPGGCYNQRDVKEPQRRSVDDEIVPPPRGSRMDRDLDRQLLEGGGIC